MVFGRPILIWVILMLLAYSIYGTVENLMAGTAAIEQYGKDMYFIGTATGFLSLWLLIELWMDHPRQVSVSWGLFALLSATQIYAIALYVPIPDDELSTRAEYGAVGVFTMVMIAVYSLVPLYLTRRRRRAA